VRKEGDLWSIALDGAAVHVKHSKGVVYLARLLAEPGRDQFAIELAGGAAPFSDAGEVLDTAARRAYRERLTDLRVELEQAEEDHDLAKSERCREELDALASQLAAAVGLGGRVRRAGDANERARQSVTKAIGRTIRKLAGIDERLGRHLSNTVRTGVTCRYEPDPGRLVNWRVED
jgi:non-specific serine/threonine protein kinase